MMQAVWCSVLDTSRARNLDRKIFKDDDNVAQVDGIESWKLTIVSFTHYEISYSIAIMLYSWCRAIKDSSNFAEIS